MLLVAVGVMAILVLCKMPWRGGGDCLVKSAYANQVGAAPGFIAMTLAGGATGRDSVGGIQREVPGDGPGSSRRLAVA